jgi:hypothetical protein
MCAALALIRLHSLHSAHSTRLEVHFLYKHMHFHKPNCVTNFTLHKVRNSPPFYSVIHRTEKHFK